MKNVGRNISCGIVTKIEVRNKNGLKENKEDILKRIGKVLNLKYYEEGFSDNDKYMCLYLKEDLFNKEFKNLLLELVEIELFMKFLYFNIKAINSISHMPSKEMKKAIKDYLDNQFDLKVKRKYKKKYDYENKEEEIDKNNYVYFLDNVLEFSGEIELSWENYLYCTDMYDDTQFDDNITNLRDFRVAVNHIPLYFDINKTDSEDITFTLRILNCLLRKALKNELKNTLIFGLTD